MTSIATGTVNAAGSAVKGAGDAIVGAVVTAPIKAVEAVGKSIVNAIKALHGKFKMPYRIVETVAVDPRARDLSSEVAKAKASNADILWTTNLLHDAILTTKEMVKQRWTPMGVLSSGPGYFDEAYYKTLGKHSDFILSFTPWVDPSKPLTARFLRKFHEMYPGAKRRIYM